MAQMQNTTSKSDKDPYSEEAQMNARAVTEWYDRIANSREKCPFCDLKDKYIISEKDGLVLTVNLFPYIDGHLMVIPRRHIESFEDLSDDEMLTLKKLIDTGMRVLKEEMAYKDLNVLYREGSKESGSSLKHLHIHILPITGDFLQYEKVQFKWVFQKINFPPREVAERLRSKVSA